MKSFLRICVLGTAALVAAPIPAAETVETDICVFGGTCGGIAAALQAARMGKSVALVEPSPYLGGLTTGGLGATDIGNKAAVGGISREFYQRIAQHYSQPAAWKFEAEEDYFRKHRGGQAGASSLSGDEATMWTFEPQIAERVFLTLLREAKVPVHTRQRLASVTKTGARITELKTETGDVFRAKMFIDATYEGDLLAKAGVRYHVGREANAVYGETLNGIRAETPKHQFTVPVDPYVKPGDPASGLLPLIQSGDLGQAGAGDRKVQTYNYRLCFTTNAANRLPLPAPPGYDPARYELLARYLEALVGAGKRPTLEQFWNPIWMPNHKTDINNNGGFSTDFIGMNWDYPEASYAERERLAREHELYIRGFLHFLATSPRVPANIRAEMREWGPCRDEFPQTGGWPRELYVREARRMIGAYVMSEKNCRRQETVPDAIGLAAYNMDSHNVQRIVRNGRAENEGDVQVPPMQPYPISYRALTPKADECVNLLVPVCLSASHIAYGSIRMEPVFMILGQSTATAAALAINAKSTVQEVDYVALRQRLLADRQILEWTGPKKAAATPTKLDGLVLDDDEATAAGDWEVSTSLPFRSGTGYRHDGNGHKGAMKLTFTAKVPAAGTYEVSFHWPPADNRATQVPVTVTAPEAAPQKCMLNQRERGSASLGSYPLAAGQTLTVTVSNEGTTGHVVADAVQLRKQ